MVLVSRSWSQCHSTGLEITVMVSRTWSWSWDHGLEITVWSTSQTKPPSLSPECNITGYINDRGFPKCSLSYALLYFSRWHLSLHTLSRYIVLFSSCPSSHYFAQLSTHFKNLTISHTTRTDSVNKLSAKPVYKLQWQWTVSSSLTPTVHRDHRPGSEDDSSLLPMRNDCQPLSVPPARGRAARTAVVYPAPIGVLRCRAPVARWVRWVPVRRWRRRCTGRRAAGVGSGVRRSRLARVPIGPESEAGSLTLFYIRTVTNTHTEVEQSLTPHPTQYRSFRRRSSQPITWPILTNKALQENKHAKTKYKSLTLFYIRTVTNTHIFRFCLTGLILQGAYRTLKAVFHDFTGLSYVRFLGLSRTIYVHFPCLSRTA